MPEQAVHSHPAKRQDSLSEFLFDLRHANATCSSTSSTPPIERNPLLSAKARPSYWCWPGSCCWRCSTSGVTDACAVPAAGSDVGVCN